LTRTFAWVGRIAAENARDESRKSFGSGISSGPSETWHSKAWLYPSTISYEQGSGIVEGAVYERCQDASF
jgi:hypothetical protein